MSSCKMNNPDSDEEVDLEALRLAALKSRKAKFGPRINRSNLIPIVPTVIETPEFDETKIKKEKVSPIPEENDKKEHVAEKLNKEKEDDKTSNCSGSSFENDQDILSVDDKEEEDSLERLMDQLEAEISGKVPINTDKNTNLSAAERKRKRKKTSRKAKEDDDEIELLKITKGREPGAIIEIRESVSPENKGAEKKSSQDRSPNRKSRSQFKSRSRSPFSRNYRRSRSPYWSRSPHRSKSPGYRSRSPYWLSRPSRSPYRKSRSPLRRYRSPQRRSPYSRYTRSRSKSYDKRRSPWSISPRRRSKSPFYPERSPGFRRRNYLSPSGRFRRSFSPRDGNISPRRRSRSPRRFQRTSPFRRSRSPFRRSLSPFKRFSPGRRPLSPFSRRSKSPVSKLNSPKGKRAHSKTPTRWSVSPGRRPTSLSRLPGRPRSKSPANNATGERSPRHKLSKNVRSVSISTSPTPRRNRSPLRAVEKNKLDSNDKNEKPKYSNRNDKRHRSLSRENNKCYDRQNRQRNFRKFSPPRNKRNVKSQNKSNRSPEPMATDEKNKQESSKVKETESNVAPTVPLDPILEARKKKFENFSEVDLSKDREISLKAIKEPVENAEEDEDALTINLESNLWDESEDSGDECESRFKTGEARKTRTEMPNRGVLSFRNLRDGDVSKRQNLLNKPLIEESRSENIGRSTRSDRWHGRRGRDDGRSSAFADSKRGNRNYDLDKNKCRNIDKNNSHNASAKQDRWSERKSTWSEKNRKEDDSLTSSTDKRSGKTKGGEKNINESKDKAGKSDGLAHEADDFDKLISDFEKELESDICLTGQLDSLVSDEGTEANQPLSSLKQDLLEKKINEEEKVKKPTLSRTVKITRPSMEKKDLKMMEAGKDVHSAGEGGPEDYIEDDDFELDMSAKRNTRAEDEDGQSDLRAVLSKRRNQRLTKVVNLKEDMPARLVQSAFQGLGDKKIRKQEREISEAAEPFTFDKKLRNSANERRRVLLLQREKDPCVTSKMNVVQEVIPDTTIYQRFPRSSERRKRKLQRPQDPAEDLIMNEEEGFGIEEGKQSRRFRLKRNVTLSSQTEC
ncbi:hypothetical protein RUM43_001450 [Polyplax serrata]|uniref:Uncharacterized protein n=1 Tax=Polyplax serrata TaxID=468196 RepID=A0AAN8XQ97_POLSC